MTDNRRWNDPQEEDRFINELVRYHEQLKAGADAHPTESATDDAGIPNRLDPARKVIDLLMRTRPDRLPAAETDGDCGAGTETPAFETSTPDATARPPLPSKIGRFEIQSLLGKGGFGLVFLALDPELGRPLAIKVPQLYSLLDSDAQARFLREGRVLAALNHPGIVPVYEVGNDGAIAYIASEYIRGLNLREFVSKHGAVNPRDGAKIVRDLADAIQHAHARGVIHRDLKPANVLLEVTEEGEDDLSTATVRVTDFGLAKLLDEVEAEVTRTGSVIGTPAFAAPEQLNSTEDSEATAGADVYSLGAILYFLLTGQAPFESRNLAKAIQEAQHQTPVALNKLNPAIPADLAAVCTKCLQKSPTDRYVTAHSLGTDLQRFLDGVGVAARPLPVVKQWWRWCRRNRLVSGMAGAATASLAVGFVSTTALMLQAQNSATQARESEAQIRRQYLQTKQVIDDYFVKVTEHPTFLSPAFAELKRELLQSALNYYEGFLKENANDDDLTLDFVTINQRLGDALLDAGNLDGAREHYFSADQLLTDDSAEPQPRVKALRALGFRKLGQVSAINGDLQKAESDYRTAAAALTSLLKDNPSDQTTLLELVRTQAKLVAVLRDQSRFEEVSELCRGQIEMIESAADSGPLSPVLDNHLSMAWGNLGVAARRNNEPKSSLQAFDESLRISERLISAHPMPVWFIETAGNTYSSRAILRFQSGLREQALEDAREAVRLFSGIAQVETSPEFVQHLSVARRNLAVMLRITGNDHEADWVSGNQIDELRRLAERFPDIVAFHISLIESIHNRCTHHLLQYELDEAAALAKEVQFRLAELQEKFPARKEFDAISASSLAARARLARLQHRLDESRSLYDQAVNLREQELQLRPDDPELSDQLAILHENRAFTLAELGLHSEAVEARRAALRLCVPEERLLCRLYLAESLARTGDVTEARDLITAAASELSQRSPDSVSSGQLMQLAFSQAALAIATHSGSPDQQSNNQQNDDMQMAEAAFLQAVERGYFDGRPDRIEIINRRDDLSPLFERAPVASVLKGQREDGKSR